MKKIISLFVLSSALILSAACNNGEISSKPESEPTSEQPASTSEPTSTSQPDTSETSSIIPSSSSTSSEPIATTVTFVLHGEAQPFSSYGVQINNAGGSNNRDMLLANMNEQAGVDIVKSISAENIYAQSDNGQHDKEHIHLTIGSGGAGGTITFTFEQEISSVRIECSPYYKTTAPDPCDSDAQFMLEDELCVPEQSATKPQPTSEFTYGYTKASKKLTLANDSDHQRVFINVIEVTFK